MPDEETVVEEKSVTESQDAQEEVDIDKIMAEWPDEPVSETPEAKVTAKDLQESVTWIRQHHEQTQQEQTDKDIGEAVKVIREEMGEAALSEKAIRRMLNGAAGEDPRLRKAWVGRHQNPEGYNRILKGVAKEFSSELAAMPDKEITQDREAVAAAVRGASTKVSDAAEIPANVLNGTASDQEFNAWKRSFKK